MDTVNVSIAVPKESKELVDAVDGLLEHVLAGKSLAELSALIPAILQAADGLNKIGEEVKSQQLDEAAGYLVHKLVGTLRKPRVVQAVDEAPAA